MTKEEKELIADYRRYVSHLAGEPGHDASVEILALIDRLAAIEEAEVAKRREAFAIGLDEAATLCERQANRVTELHEKAINMAWLLSVQIRQEAANVRTALAEKGGGNG